MKLFEVVGIIEDAAKIRSVPLYLNDIAIVWWRRSEDIKRETCTINTWKTSPRS